MKLHHSRLYSSPAWGLMNNDNQDRECREAREAGHAGMKQGVYEAACDKPRNVHGMYKSSSKQTKRSRELEVSLRRKNSY